MSRAWHEIVHETLKRNDVRLVTYVPDKVLKPLIESVRGERVLHGPRHDES